MKVKIGPYLDYLGPFQIAEKLLFWFPKQKDEFGFTERHDWVYALGHFFAYGTFDTNDTRERTKFAALCEWIHSKRKRTVKIKTDRWDHWNAHNTISMLALPILRDLREHKQGHSWIDDADAPENLRAANAVDSGESNGGWDSNNAARHEWVLDEIIWALEQDQPDRDWEEQYRIVPGEIDWNKYPEDDGKDVTPLRWVVEPKTDWDGMKKHQERINNGFRLLGKYWQTLWS